MTLVKLPNGKIVKGGPRIIHHPVPKSTGILKQPIRVNTSYNTFLAPDSASFKPLLPFYMSGQQNAFNVPPEPRDIGHIGYDGGLPLNPIKISNKDHR